MKTLLSACLLLLAACTKTSEQSCFQCVQDVTARYWGDTVRRTVYTLCGTDAAVKQHCDTMLKHWPDYHRIVTCTKQQ